MKTNRYIEGETIPKKLNLPEKEVINLYINKKIKPEKIGDMYNCSYGTIYNLLKRNNIKLKFNRLELPEKEIIDLYINKIISMNNIADIYKCSVSKISGILKSNNIKLRSQTSPLHIPTEKIIDDYQHGMSTYQIAEKYNCSNVTIGSILKQNNIEIRSRSESVTRFNLPVDQIITEYKYGISTSILAEKYNCHSITIGRLLKKSGIDITTKIDLPIKEIIEDYQSGMNPNEIAEKYNCSNVTIFNRLTEHNIHVRTLKEISNTFITNVCIKCGHDFLGNPRSLYCPECSPTKYCYKFDEECRESNRDKYNRECFFCGKLEKENDRKLNVHHVDYNKNQGCGKTPDWKLVPLCNNCHSMTNSGIENRKMWEARILYLHKEYWSEII